MITTEGLVPERVVDHRVGGILERLRSIDEVLGRLGTAQRVSISSHLIADLATNAGRRAPYHMRCASGAGIAPAP
jgi:hypothetical protein